MKVRSRTNSVMSGASTLSGGWFKSLSEGDLHKADAMLSNTTAESEATVDAMAPVNSVNGH